MAGANLLVSGQVPRNRLMDTADGEAVAAGGRGPDGTVPHKVTHPQTEENRL
jgi:hypothetical protein